MTVALAPNFTTFASGKCRYRPRAIAILNGRRYVANGYDRPYYWPNSGSTLYDMGSDAPSHATLPSTAGFFTVADAAAGTTFPAGTVVALKLVFRRSTQGKETAPEEQWADSDGYVRTAYVVHTMTGTKDITVTWVGANVPAEFDKVVIYRALLDEDVFFLDQEVASATGTATLSTVDDDLALNRPYVARYAITKPSRNTYGILAHLNRLWLWDDLRARVTYTQVARTDSDDVSEDAPPENLLDVSPEDAGGIIRAGVVRYGAINFYKRLGCYEVTGPTLGDPIPHVRRLFANRGALNQRCVVPLDGRDVVLDEQGIYFSIPDAEPVPAAISADGSRSAIDPIIDRFNLSAWRYFSGIFDRTTRLVLFAVALDFDPVPRHVIVFDPVANRIVSIDTARKALAWGYLADALGSLHLLFGDDTGRTHEDGYLASEGVHAGSQNVNVVSGTGTTLTTDGTMDTTEADGPAGAPFQRRAADGTLIETNWVYSVGSSTAFDPLYYSSTAAASTQDVFLGIIPAAGELPKMGWEDGKRVEVRDVRISADKETSGTLRISGKRDDGAFALKRTLTLSDDTVQWVVPVDDRAWTWAMRFDQHQAGAGFSLRAVHIRHRVFEDRGL